MTCPNCGYLFSAFETRCPRCPNTVPAAAPQLRTASEPTQAFYGHCAACRQPAIDASGKCTACGYTTCTPKKRLSPVALTLIAIAACACLGGITVVAQQGIRSAEESVTGILGFESLSAPSSDILVPPVVDDGQMQQRLLSASAVGGGDLEISLAWNSLSDLDLQVLEPEGELITARHRQSQSGGVMDVDANPTLLSRAGEEAVHSGRQPRPEDVIPLPEEFVDLDRKLGLPPGSNPLETTTSGGSIRFTHYPVEHIYFDHAPKGKFTVYAHCYSWREPNVTPLPFTVQIRSKGHVVSETSGMAGPMSAIADGASPIQVCEFVLH